MSDSQYEIEVIKKILIDNSNKSFWWFCKALEPDFYKDSRPYLKELCDTLQALYEGRIIKFNDVEEWQIVDSTILLNNPIVCNKLMINIPPQHGKSRTLVNFCKWCLGKNNKERIITWSYNDDTASDFSRYTRDGIVRKKEFPYEVDYSDIFPNTRLKQGNSGYEQWAVEGSHFSYKGAGLNGSITGKSGTIRIVDDPIKDSTEALNEDRLEWIWKKYTDTFLSRMSGKHIDIVNHTRWNSKDLCGKLLDKQADKWYIFKREAYDKETDSMLCSELLSKADYDDIKSLSSPEIFNANYHQEPIDIQGRLYNTLNVYQLKYQDGKPYGVRVNSETNEIETVEFESIVAYIDTADTGNDYLCAIVAGLCKGELFVLDVLYTKDAMEITEPKTAKLLYMNKVNNCTIESNNGGRGFARTISRLLYETYHSRKTIIKQFHQSKKKITRILTMATFIMQHVYFPSDWDIRYPDFYSAITNYQKAGKNKNDDASDALTGLCEMQVGKTNVKVVNMRR